MNYKIVFNTLGKAMLLIALLMAIPLFIGLIYAENLILPFIIPIGGLIVIGLPLAILRPSDKIMYAKEGFVIVALCWIILSLFGSLPYIISGAVSSFDCALFESVSGFSTTGASVIADVESLPKCILFWRSFTHFIGGMGVLVFVLAVLPNSNGSAMHIFRAETPGPSSGKLVSKIKFTARILYAIYIALAIIECVLLLIGGMDVFDSVCNAFSTAGTGGFSVLNNSIEGYNNTYFEMVIAVFMFLFGINFNIYYFILIGSFVKILKDEELRIYFIIILVSTLAIAIDLLSIGKTFLEGLRYSFFQVTSISSTTGFSTADFDGWPTLSKAILLFLMIFGASAGSTGGGVKIARLGIMNKSAICDIRKTMRPRSVLTVKFNGEPVPEEETHGVRTFFLLWFLIVVLTTLLLSLDPFGDILTDITASISCISNVGPGFSLIGPTQNYLGFSWYSKIILSFVMLAGRLEIMPMLILLSPRAWKEK